MPLPPRRSFARLALTALASLSLLSGCTAAQKAPASPSAAAESPRLIVFMVVDGLPMRQVTGYRDLLQPDGFRRFLDRGVWFSEAHYGHAHTVTAAGHATMLTGAYPQRSGIISNEWVDPQTRQPVYNTMDPAYHYIGHKTAALAGTSPRMLLAETVGDVLRSRDPGSKVIGISGKDRGAILPAGHKGTAYMFMSETGRFASTSYYMPAHPDWVESFNASGAAEAFFGKAWAPALPGYDCPSSERSCPYARSVPDGQSWQSQDGLGNRLPATLGAGLKAPAASYYASLLPSPFGDELTLQFARAALAGEQLGSDDKPDILSISLSSHDYVNHAFGPESRLSQDHLLHLDRLLQAFFRDLDQRVGRDRYLLVLTADHGFADTPEWAASQGRDAKRLPGKELVAFANQGLSKSLGDGPWVTGLSAMGMLFDEALIRRRGLEPAKVYAEARRVMLQHPDVEAAYTPEELAGSDAAPKLLAQMRKSWHPDRAAPLQVIMKQGRLFGSRPQGSSHGTPWRYDTHVPLLAWGERWVGQGEVKTPVEIADLAPSLSAILGLRAPAQSQGLALPWPRAAKAP